MNPWVGAWAIISGHLASMAALWGVTPQAQKTGMTPLGISFTGSALPGSKTSTTGQGLGLRTQ